MGFYAQRPSTATAIAIAERRGSLTQDAEIEIEHMREMHGKQAASTKDPPPIFPSRVHRTPVMALLKRNLRTFAGYE